ncbi:hypothetical protein [Gleimia hominis]|uniref:hypothetical protein n=1 Tax=Gleimia hominis TaxID=595468 RepID=UPI0011AFD18C|nr:hypothetical protein [Gleimia hominis]WIK64849.1 hypothetical protein CJ187_001955 [Gleimia hominis]
MRDLHPSEENLLDSIGKVLTQRARTEAIPKETIDEAARMVGSIVNTRPTLDSMVGPTCGTADLVDWLGISRQAINKALKEYRLLGVRMGTRSWKYPVWQLTDDHQIVSGMAQVLGRIYDVASSVENGHWFVTPNTDLDNVTPADWMRDGKELNTVVGAAERYARRLR